MKPALGSSPIGLLTTGTHALDVLCDSGTRKIPGLGSPVEDNRLDPAPKGSYRGATAPGNPVSREARGRPAGNATMSQLSSGNVPALSTETRNHLPPGRRMLRLLSYLATTTHGYSDATLRAKFGTHVESLLTALFVANHIERDLGNRWRLTVSGRNLARRAA